MRTARLGTLGPEISVIGFGAWEAGGAGWGPNPPTTEVLHAFHAAFEAGMNWVDTAETYGYPGRSERLVGRAVARRDILVFTKVSPFGSGVDPAGVRRGAERSARRLRRDVIDLYQVHWPDERIPVERTWEAMARLVDDGLVRYIGVSNFTAEQVARCESIRHVDAAQPQLSLLHREARSDVLPVCRANGTGVICYAPLAYGLLTGALTGATAFAPDDWRSGRFGGGEHERLFAPRARERHLETVERLRPIADSIGVTLAQLALAWAVHQDGVTAAIAGTRSATHAVENAGAGSVALTLAVLEEIERALTREPGP